MTTGRQDAASIFVTVGSTKFTLLIRAILSPPVLDAISKAAKETGKAVSIIVQFGATPIHEIHFDEKDGLQAIDGQATGTLPIRLLGGMQCSNDAPPSAKELAQNLSPEAIREQVTGQKQSVLEPAMGLKHFALDWKASHGIVNVELIDYVPSIGPYLQSADIVISHAGSGTILEALRVEKATRPQLVIVPNETLMDNHQTELARALGERRYVYAVRLPSKGAQGAERAGQLPDLLHTLVRQSQQDTLLQDFPGFVPGRFRAIVDEEMGFS